GKQPPTPPGGGPPAQKPQPGILAALTKLPKNSGAAGSQTMLAAVSNINAVKVPGGASSFKVSALIGRGPTTGVQIGGSGGGVETKGLNSILREGGGEGPGALGGKGKGQVRAAPAMALHRQATAQGELSREEISKVINQNMGQIQFCYEKELLKNPGLQGKVVFEWTIKQDGSVSVVRTKVGALPSPAATNCMIDKIKGWQFPKPRGNGVVVVTYPFIFKQAGF
ncbi:MAG: AgmX/PglI C-terminal domain-containing protein, partial [Myxococcota bacterium]